MSKNGGVLLKKNLPEDSDDGKDNERAYLYPRLAANNFEGQISSG